MFNAQATGKVISRLDCRGDFVFRLVSYSCLTPGQPVRLSQGEVVVEILC